MLVLEGSLTETVFEAASHLTVSSVNGRDGKARALPAGATAYINDNIGYHKVANLTNARAVSLHVYAPGWQAAPLFDEVFDDCTDAGGAPFEADWGDF